MKIKYNETSNGTTFEIKDVAVSNTSGHITFEDVKIDADYTIDKDEYYRDLDRRQKEHLDSVMGEQHCQPCLHDGCPECVGTGVKRDGSSCIHMISCPCPKCSVYC